MKPLFNNQQWNSIQGNIVIEIQFISIQMYKTEYKFLLRFKSAKGLHHFLTFLPDSFSESVLGWRNECEHNVPANEDN